MKNHPAKDREASELWLLKGKGHQLDLSLAVTDAFKLACRYKQMH